MKITKLNYLIRTSKRNTTQLVQINILKHNLKAKNQNSNKQFKFILKKEKLKLLYRYLTMQILKQMRFSHKVIQMRIS